jgi:hypothetical protein
MPKQLSNESVTLSLAKLLEEVMADDGVEMQTRARAADMILSLAKTEKRGTRIVPGTATIQ